MAFTYINPAPYFDFDERQFSREDHSWLCEKALRDDSAFPTLPRYDNIPNFPLKDIFAKVLGRTEGMFPFLLHVAPDEAVVSLRAFFKSQGYCLKQNTAFTLLKSQKVERSTFQVLSPGLQRKRAKVSVYVTKLATGENKVIIEFRRSERNPVTVPTEFLDPRDGWVEKSGSGEVVAVPETVEYGACVPQRPGIASFASDAWKDETAKQLEDWFLTPTTSIACVGLPAMRTIDRASAAIEASLRSLQDIKNEDKVLQHSNKRIKLDVSATGSILSDNSSVLDAPVVNNYVSASTAVAPIALWWNLNSNAPSPTRSSFDEMIEYVLRHCQIKPRSETLQDRCDSFCSAIRLTEGPRVSYIVLEGAELLWDDLTIVGRWFAIQRCLASAGASCKFVLIFNRHANTDSYNLLHARNVLRIRVPGEIEQAPPQPQLSQHHSAAHRSSSHTSSLANSRQLPPASVVIVPKLPLGQQSWQMDQSISYSETYPQGLSSPTTSESQSDDFSPMESHHHHQHHEQPSLFQHQQLHHQQMQHHLMQHQQLPEPQLDWEWQPAAPMPPASLMFTPLQAPTHPTLYNIYDAFVASSYPPFDMFARPQPTMWFPGPPVMQ